MGVYNGKSILDDKCISVQELNSDNLSQYCTNEAVPHKGLIIRWLKTVGVENGVIGFKNTFDPISGKMIGYFEYKGKNGYGWSNVDIFLFENYNIKLNDAFLYMFEDVSKRIEEIKKEIRRRCVRAKGAEPQIIISGKSGYVDTDEEYSDTLTITEHSIEYECTPYNPSLINPVQKWSYTTNSEAFTRLFELALEATNDIFERDPKCPGTDMPVTKFTVIYHSNKTVKKVYMVDHNEFSDCYSILKKMVPTCELMPWVLRTSDDYYKERLWHTLVL